MSQITLRKCGITMQEYARTMRIPVCSVSGHLQDCSFNCGDISNVSSDIAFAISKISSSMKVSSCKVSLCDEQDVLTSDFPYFILDDDVEFRKFNTIDVIGIPIPAITSCSDTVSFSFDLPRALDTDADEIIESIEIIRDGCECNIIFQPDWCDIKIDGTKLFVSANAWSFTSFGVSQDDCGTSSFMSNISLRIKTSMCSVPRVYYKNECTCGKVSETNKCAECEDLSCEECCFSEIKPKMRRVQCFKPCECRKNVNPLRYEADVIRRGILSSQDYRDAMIDAIVGLANYRETLDSCNLCSENAKQRLRRDLGLTLTTGEPIQGAQYMYKNPFGIYTAGAKAAWEFTRQFICEGGVFSA